MIELDRALVRRKLAAITRNLGDLGTVDGITVDGYRRDRFRQKGTERLLQEVVEAAVDVNSAGLRNCLVHEYDAIDDAIVLEAVHRARDEFAAYVAAVEQYVAPEAQEE